MDAASARSEKRSIGKPILVLALFIVTSVYFGCSYALRFPFVGMLPAEFESQSAVVVEDNGRCGVAIFKLNDEVKTRILQHEDAFFSKPASPRVSRYHSDAYVPWKKTPLPSFWTNAELGKNRWSGLGCSTNSALIETVTNAAWHEGGYYTYLNRGTPAIVAFPKLGLVVVSYISF